MDTSSLTESLRETLAVFDSAEPRTTPEVAEQLSLGRRGTYARLERLVEEEVLETKKVGANARVWWRLPSRLPDYRDQPDQTDTSRESSPPLSVTILDNEGHVRSVNDGFKQMTGFETKEVLGKHLSRFYQQTGEAIDPAIQLRTASTRGSVEWECKRIRKDGPAFSASVTLTAIRDAKGTITGFVEVTYDLSSLRKTELELDAQAQQLQRKQRELRGELSEIFNRISDGFYTLDQEFRFRYFNDQAKELLDLDDSAIGTKIREAIYVTDAFSTALDKAEEAQETHAQEVYYPPLERWFRSVIYPSEEGYSVYFHDISDRKEREHLLKRYIGVIEALGEPIYELDTNGRFVFVNEAFTDLSGYQEEELLGEHASLCMGESGVTQIESAVKVTGERGEARNRTGQFDLIAKDGQRTPVEARISYLIREDQVQGTVGTVWDISERKKREEELRNTKAKLEAATKAGRIGTWEWHIGENRVMTGDWFTDQFGGSQDAGSEEISLDEFLAPVHEQDRNRVADELDSAGEQHADFESEFRVNDDGDIRWVIARGRVKDDRNGRPATLPGAVTDITDQKQTEHLLERRQAQNRVIAEMGQCALTASDITGLLTDTCHQVPPVLENDDCNIFALNTNGDELRLRQGVKMEEGTTVELVENTQVGYTLGNQSPVVVENLDNDSRFSRFGLDANDEMKSGITAIIGAVDDPWGILTTHATDKRTYTDEDVNFVKTVASVLGSTITRINREQQLTKQQQELSAMNNLNDVVNQITDAVIGQSTRSEIEQTVCDALAAADSYEFAWIAEVDQHANTFTPRVSAEIDIDTDERFPPIEDIHGMGPAARAIRELEPKVSKDIVADSAFETDSDATIAYGFRAVASIPIVHDGGVYGVLGVYTDRHNAFEAEELNVIGQLGEVIGHAITATERKRALLSDELIELEFEITDIFADHCFEMGPKETITIENIVPLSDQEYLVSGRVSNQATDTMRHMVDEIPSWESITIQSKLHAPRFELRVVDPPILGPIAANGGHVETAIIENGNLRMTIQLPARAKIRQVLSSITEAHPQANLLRRQQITRTQEDPRRIQQRIVADLTEMQRTTLEAAFNAGFFKWPREETGKEVAESIGIAPSTFSQHLRKSQQKVFESLFQSSDGQSALTSV